MPLDLSGPLHWLAELRDTAIADAQALWRNRAAARAAWRNASQLLVHRRLLIDTCAPTPMPAGTQVVLRTRIRLMGDTQTDILRLWAQTATAAEIAATAATHFSRVAAVSDGWSAMLGLRRMGTRLLMTAGSIAGLVSGFRTLQGAPAADWWHVVATRLLGPASGLLWGAALLVLGYVVRWVLRWRLRKLFADGLSPGDRAAPPAG
jgi:hypothetical protein